MTPKLFIGSSSEFLFIAKELEAILNTDFEVTVWDSLFKHGDFFLESLQKELYLTDFGLFVITPDDRLSVRGNKTYSTRDNVIFELGMFIGALGIRRAYFVVVDITKADKSLKLKIPSDLDGVKKTRLKLELTTENKLIDCDDNRDAIQNACITIKNNLLNAKERLLLSLLPSTSLAVGYFRNFILQACKELSLTKKFQVDDQYYDLTKDKSFDFFIVVPDKGFDMSHEGYRKFVKRNALKQIEIHSTSSPRTFPFFIRTSVKDNRIQLYDLPTTLRASYDAIRLVMPSSTSEHEYEKLEIKEITNFIRTIEHLLRSPESCNFRENIHIIYENELMNI